VGKSTVAVNLAVALAQKGARVGLLDADMYGPNCHIMLGVTKAQPSQVKKIAPALAHGVKVISMGMLVRPDQALMWRGPMLHSAIREFLNDVEWGELDYLLIDLPPGTGDAQLSLAQSAHLNGSIIVTLPQIVSQADARRGLEMFRQLNVPIWGVVENMSGEMFGSGGGETLAEETGIPFLGRIPLQAPVRVCGDSGVPVVVAHPNTAAAQALDNLAEQIMALTAAQHHADMGDFEIETIE
jgi:ATP-binding protein involved in chromosome partitioning